MLWWQPNESGAGYEDGWARGSFRFSGTGRHRDQTFEYPYHENGRLRDHKANGDEIRLLRYIGKNLVQYVGQLEMPSTSSWYWRDGRDDDGVIRRIIQFVLHPVDVDPVVEAARPTSVSKRSRRPLQRPKDSVIRRVVEFQETTVKQAELELVGRFADWASQFGVVGEELRIARPLQADLRVDYFAHSHNLMVEAKASAARESIRMALGQVLDYSRFVDPEPLAAILVPALPPDDLVRLVGDLGVAAAWETGEGEFRMAVPAGSRWDELPWAARLIPLDTFDGPTRAPVTGV